MIRKAVLIGMAMVLGACAPSGPSTAAPSQSTLYVLRLDPAALVELDQGASAVREVPLVIPAECGIGSLFAAPRGAALALEVSCPFGPSVLRLNPDTGALKQPITNSDSHFLAWADSGEAAYLKVDTINRPRIVRAGLDGEVDEIPVSELTYDLAPEPGSPRFLFSLSRGMGLGSEMWIAGPDGRPVKQIAADPANYLSLERWSPDGRQIAFVKIPDTNVPFTVGELWIMDSDGSHARRLASADAGHGFAPSWSPDGTKLAFVHRDNPDEAAANQSAAALKSSLHVIDVNSEAERALTSFESARVEAPAWQPGGSKIAFAVSLDDKMTAYIADLDTGALRVVPMNPICCPVWLRK